MREMYVSLSQRELLETLSQTSSLSCVGEEPTISAACSMQAKHIIESCVLFGSVFSIDGMGHRPGASCVPVFSALSPLDETANHASGR